MENEKATQAGVDRLLENIMPEEMTGTKSKKKKVAEPTELQVEIDKIVDNIF